MVKNAIFTGYNDEKDNQAYITLHKDKKMPIYRMMSSETVACMVSA